mmetsp:Transcript_11249/g.29436  ORF Transcript_11249/g.29436 Transcript_11249/m.29436 type:complete len:149 (-) Transcript_11249:930-1376(-)
MAPTHRCDHTSRWWAEPANKVRGHTKPRHYGGFDSIDDQLVRRHLKIKCTLGSQDVQKHANKCTCTRTSEGGCASNENDARLAPNLIPTMHVLISESQTATPRPSSAKYVENLLLSVKTPGHAGLPRSVSQWPTMPAVSQASPTQPME